MDVRAENRGRLHQKVRFPCGPGDGESLLTLGLLSVRARNVRSKCRPEIYVYVVFPSPIGEICLKFSICDGNTLGKFTVGHGEVQEAGAGRYGCITKNAANNLGEIPQRMGTPNPLFFKGLLRGKQ